MAKIVKKLTDLVGNTPLMELSGYCGKYGMEQNIIAKLEAFNPAGSVKDRVALSMIEDAEARGTLKPGATIIEPTSGNTGVGLAMVSTIKGYHLILTMPETMSLERRNLLKALGAQIVLTDGLGGMAASIAKAEELRDSIPGSGFFYSNRRIRPMPPFTNGRQARKYGKIRTAKSRLLWRELVREERFAV